MAQCSNFLLHFIKYPQQANISYLMSLKEVCSPKFDYPSNASPEALEITHILQLIPEKNCCPWKFGKQMYTLIFQ